MSAVRRMQQQMSLAKSLKYAGVSKCAWYYKPRTREVRLDRGIVDAVSRISARWPTYGARRMAAQVSRETGVPVNCKQIQRIYRKTGYIDPQKTKNDITRTNRRLFKPETPNRLWDLDITYICVAWTAGATALTWSIVSPASGYRTRLTPTPPARGHRFNHKRSRCGKTRLLTAENTH